MDYKKFDIFAKKYLSVLNTVLFCAGLLYFGFLSDHNYNGKTYFSENALLPGMVNEQFMDDYNAQYWYNDILKFANNGSIESGFLQKYLLNEFNRIDVEASVQNFTLRYPLIMGTESAIGQNVYAVVRSPRSARQEALLLSVPLRSGPPDGMSKDNEFKDATAASVGLMLALARHARRRGYWAKDLIFLFVEMENTGMRAFLDAYYGVESSSYLTMQDLNLRSGSIQAGLTLEMAEPSFNTLELRLEGLNGLMPNLDLVNLCVRMAGKFSVPVQLHGSLNHHNPHTPSAAKRALQTLFKGMMAQAGGSPSGLSGHLMAYSVPGVTLKTIRTNVHSVHGLFDMGRIIEGVLRSTNNLLERFHQSFFFYLMPRTDRYISIGVYAPPLGIMMLPSLLSMLHLWFGDSRRRPASLTITLIPAALILLLCNMTGSFASTYFIGMSSVFGIELENGLFAGLASLHVASCCFPLLLARHKVTAAWLLPNGVDWHLLKATACGVLLLSLVTISCLNASLGFFGALCLIPPTIMCRPVANRMGRYVLRLFIQVFSPLVLLIVLCWASDARPTQLLIQAAIEKDLLDVITYRVVASVLWPCWMLIWFISFCSTSQPVSFSSCNETKKTS